jgi:hypothetical protein
MLLVWLYNFSFCGRESAQLGWTHGYRVVMFVLYFTAENLATLPKQMLQHVCDAGCM